MSTTNHTHLHETLASVLGEDRYAEINGDDVEAIAAAVQADVAYARSEAAGPDPRANVERLVDVEQFRCVNVNILEQLPGEDDVDVPQVILAFEGIPSKLTLTGSKTYVTAITGETAIALGGGIRESGKDVKKATDKLARELGDAPAKIELARTPADMARAAAESRAAEALRGPGPVGHGPVRVDSAR